MASAQAFQPTPEQITQLQAAINERGWRGFSYTVACGLYYALFTITSIPLFRGFGLSGSAYDAYLVEWIAAFIALDVLAYKRRAARLDVNNWFTKIVAGQRYIAGSKREMVWKLSLLGLNIFIAILLALLSALYGEDTVRGTLISYGLAFIFPILFSVWLGLFFIWPSSLPMGNSASTHLWKFYTHSGNAMLVAGRHSRDGYLIVFLALFLFCLIIISNLNLQSDMMHMSEIGMMQLSASCVVGISASLPFSYKYYAIARSLHQQQEALKK